MFHEFTEESMEDSAALESLRTYGLRKNMEKNYFDISFQTYHLEFKKGLVEGIFEFLTFNFFFTDHERLHDMVQIFLEDQDGLNIKPTLRLFF